MKKYLFIINPKSGTVSKKHIPELIRYEMDPAIIDTHVSFTESAGHATKLAKEAVLNGFDSVICVGGDGTVNECAQALSHTRVKLGIIPAGSGNGLALHFGIPLDAREALKTLNKCYELDIDSLKINDRFCIGTFGLGFDAHIAHLFAASEKRGYYTYVKLVLGEFYKYNPKDYLLQIDGEKHLLEAFLLTVANGSQFGNNAVIAPFADPGDGIIDVSVMKKFPLISAPSLIYRMMKNTLYKSKYFESFRAKEILVYNNIELKCHIDGESCVFNSDIHVKMQASSIRMLVPLEYKIKKKT
ncbi:MAG: diacylglycerol kinase family lipid kinase [Bacteroidetes bacterium]|nr:MAG: diacylglycerol kinase family lipid kinase [Bacteroidota bacterium]REJ99940.1 MAG: diacylglycerol kinase family lipid kinase [Bacteroidota bacterium]REK35880.1 MAG: diacylglycerol kinase family lipid kinase [Bacteroidota bacterium]REK50643.1 MAG: diacylglycerol kinase family lipid kinase [Bacteroidota bacterium]